jgi:hypothetical protein
MYLLVSLFLSGLVILAFVIGVKMARREGGLPKHERKELQARREFMATLSEQAAEHVGLGDPFAAIVLDLLREERKRLS